MVKNHKYAAQLGGCVANLLPCASRPWNALTRFVDNGVLETDRNFIGNAIRRSAVIYTLLGSCRRHGINPFDYLKDLFTRLPCAKITEIRQFTPAGASQGAIPWLASAV